MNSKHTWTWIIVAAVLFAFIFFFERHWRKPDTGPQAILPGFKAAAVTSVQVYPAGQFEIRAERTNGTWLLTKPISSPAQSIRIEALLDTLQRLTPAAPPLTARELRNHPKAEAEYGLENPQALLVLQQNEYSPHVRIGAPTAPGDQVFLRVEGIPDIFVVGADLLKLIPRATNDWRDTSFLNLQPLTFDRLIISNAANMIELQRGSTNNHWRMTGPIPARASDARILEFLQQLQSLQIAQFVTDDPAADRESFGLQPPALELALAHGTNPVARLYIGKTNGAGQVFARRRGLPGIVAVPAELPVAWRAASFSDFRDPHLLSLPSALGPVEVRGDDRFALLPQTNGWRLSPEAFPVDNKLADDFLAGLASFEVEFYKNAVTEPELRANGLIAPAREITLKLPATADATNGVFVQLAFGITNDNKVLVARADEDSIYALKLADFQQLPWASWQLRERRVAHFTEEDVSRLTIRQAGKVRELQRLGTNSWTLAPGSQGIINPFAIEETTHRLGELEATLWVEHAAKDLGRYGISTNSLALTFELKNGGKFAVAFGDLAPSQYPYAAVTLGQEAWVFEFPRALYELLLTYLTPTSNTP